MRPREAGQVAPLVAVLVALAAAVVLLVGAIGVRLRDASRAQTAADAAALAGAADGAGAAARVAAANGATVVSSSTAADGTFRVEVRVGRASARASAAVDDPCAVPSADHLVHSPQCPPTTPG